MFSSLKIGLVLVMLAGAGGGYLYINKLQKDNATLKSNQIKLESAVEDQKAVIQTQAEDFKKIRSTLTKLKVDGFSDHGIHNYVEYCKREWQK